MSATTTRVLIEAAHWDAGRRCSAPAGATSSPPRPASATSAASTRRSATAARRPGRRAARRARRRHRRAGRDRGRRAAGRAARSRSPSTCPARIAGIAIAARDDGRQPARPSAATSPRPAPTCSTVTAAAVAARTSPTRTTWSRRSSGIVGYDQVPVGAAAGARRPRADPRASGCAAGSAARWPARLRRGAELPVRRRRRPRRARPARRRPAPHRAAAGQPALRRGAVAAPPRCCPGLLAGRRPQRRPRQRRRRRSSRPAPVTLPRDRRPGARSCGVDRRPTEGELADARQGACPTSRCTSAVVARRRARARRLVGRGPRRPAGPTRSRRSARSPTRSASRSTVARRPAARPGTPAGAPSSCVGGTRARPRRRAAPAGVRGATACPPRTAAAEIDLDALLERAVDVVAGAGVLDVPGGQGGRRAGRRRRRSPAADVEAALREGAGELLESVRLFDVYTGDQVGEGKKSLAFALRFRAPDRTLTERRGRRRPRRRRGLAPLRAAAPSSAEACRSVRRVSGEPDFRRVATPPEVRDAPGRPARWSSVDRVVDRRAEVVDDRQVAGEVRCESPSPRRHSRASSAAARAADHRVGLDARGRPPRGCRPRRRSMPSSGSVPLERPELHPDVVPGVGEVDADVVRQPARTRPTAGSRRTSRRGTSSTPSAASAGSSSADRAARPARRRAGGSAPRAPAGAG